MRPCATVILFLLLNTEICDGAGCGSKYACGLVRSKSVASQKHKTFGSLTEIVDHNVNGPPKNKYQLGDVIGTGMYATVFQATKRERGHQTPVAVKEIILEKPETETALHQKEKMVKNEIEISRLASQTNQPNLMKFYESYLIKKIGFKNIRFQKRKLWLVNEFVDGVSLEAVLNFGKLGYEDDLAHIIKQILTAINALHQIGIYHCDIHVRNFMVTTTGLLKLIDYGSAVRRTDDTRNCQSKDWMKFKKLFDALFKKRLFRETMKSPEYISFYQTTQVGPTTPEQIEHAFATLRSHPFLNKADADAVASVAKIAIDLKKRVKMNEYGELMMMQ